MVYQIPIFSTAYRSVISSEFQSILDIIHGASEFFDFYASAGFMTEKCISGQIIKENPGDAKYSYTGCEDRPFIFSVNASAGVQYNLSKKCGIYVEPGVGL